MSESVNARETEEGENPGTASIESYRPKLIRIKTEGDEDGVLLLNDRYHHHWNVYVDGGAKPLLRCNYIMRGVAVPAGEHVVEFRYEPPQMGFGISLASIFVGGVIVCYLGAGQRRRPQNESPAKSNAESQSP
ncbi:MAG: YfhO family protein [Verrucomicrobia bacterium]|nr:YfhO family protein [Verrucomicrobiota bacterium]